MIARMNRREIDAFKTTWPCHGLPDNLHSITCEFETNGDLADLTCRARNGRILDTQRFDGPALLALVNDCQAKGK